MKKASFIILFLFLIIGATSYSQTSKTTQNSQLNSKTEKKAIQPTSVKKQDSINKKYIPQRLEIIYAGDMADEFSAKKMFFDDFEDEDEGTETEADILYAGFDTSAIHYPKFDFSNKLDTTMIVLVKGKNEYVHPYKGRLTSPFGPRRRRYHYGNDISLKTGDSIFSAFDGVVRIAKYNKTYGNLVVVRHDNGLETFYAHLSSLEAVPEQRLKAGELLGLGGNTGRSRGSHLHFEIRYLGAAINPSDVIDFYTFKLHSDTLMLTKNNFLHHKTQSRNQLASSKTKSGKTAGTSYHKIRKGDTLGSIAGRYGTTVNTICRLNGIKSNKTLAIGKSLRVR